MNQSKLPPVEVAYLPENPTVFTYMSMPKGSLHQRMLRSMEALDFVAAALDDDDHPLPGSLRSGAAIILQLVVAELSTGCEALEAHGGVIPLPQSLFFVKKRD